MLAWLQTLFGQTQRTASILGEKSTAALGSAYFRTNMNRLEHFLVTPEGMLVLEHIIALRRAPGFLKGDPLYWSEAPLPLKYVVITFEDEVLVRLLSDAKFTKELHLLQHYCKRTGKSSGWKYFETASDLVAIHENSATLPDEFLPLCDSLGCVRWSESFCETLRGLNVWVNSEARQEYMKQIGDQAKLPLYSAATNEVEIRTRTIDEIHLPLEKTLFQLLANPAFTNELRLLVRYYDTVGGSDGAYGAGIIDGVMSLHTLNSNSPDYPKPTMKQSVE